MNKFRIIKALKKHFLINILEEKVWNFDGKMKEFGLVDLDGFC